MEWIQEQIAETIDVLPQERVKHCTAQQIVHMPVPQIQEQSADTGLVNPQFATFAVEAPQVVDSFSSIGRFCHTLVQSSPGTNRCDSTAACFFFSKTSRGSGCGADTGTNC